MKYIIYMYLADMTNEALGNVVDGCIGIILL